MKDPRVNWKSCPKVFAHAKSMKAEKDITLYYIPATGEYALTWASKAAMERAGYGVITVVKGTGTPSPSHSDDGELVTLSPASLGNGDTAT